MSTESEPTPGKPKLKIRKENEESTAERKSRSERSKTRSHGSSGFRLESLGKWLLVSFVLLAPWWKGSVGALPQALISVGMLVCLGVWFVDCLTRKQFFRSHSFLLLVFLFLGLGQIQQVNLPDFLAENLATKQLEIREDLAQQMQDNHADLAVVLREQRQVALNPSAAQYQFAYFGLLAATFFLASRFFYRRGDFLLLAAVVGFSGCLIAVFGTFQKVAGPDQIFGQALAFGGTPFGPFVNRNNAAGYLLMCLACGLATLAYSYSDEKIENGKRRESGFAEEGLRDLLLLDIRSIVAGINSWRIGLLAACGCIVAGIAVSLSRGGMISMVVGLVLLLIFMFRTGSRRAAILLLLFFIPAGVTALLTTGEQESVSERLETLQDDDLLSRELRPTLWRDSLSSLADYTALGSGVGSFPYVYKEYQTFPDTRWCFHAENIFVEILVTFGVVGGLVMGIGVLTGFYLVVGYAVLGSARNDKSVAIASMMFFLLVTQCISNFFDFGLLIPANGLLFALCFGALVGVWDTKIENEQRRHPRRLARLPRWMTLPLIVLFALLMVRNSYVFWQVHQTESANLTARTRNVADLTLEEIENSIDSLESVLDKRPNLQTHEYLAQLYLLRLRHQFVDFQLANLPPDIQVPRDEVWANSTFRLINFRLSRMRAEAIKLEVERWMKTDFFRSNINLATEQFEQALAACPMSVRSIIGLAELAYFNQVDVEPYLTAFSGHNVRRTDFLLRMGDVAMAHRNKKLGIKFWRLAIESSEVVASDIVQTAILFLPSKDPFVEKSVSVLEEDDIVYDLLPGDSLLIKKIIDRFFSGPESGPAREKLYQRIKEILGNEVYTDAESNYLLHLARLETGEIFKAIDSLETATMLAPFETRWRAQLARLFAQVGDFDRALQEIKKCVDAEPTNSIFLRQLEEYREY